MKPITFKGHNTVIAKDQPQYLPLPAYRWNDEQGTIVFCMSVSRWEAIKMLFSGRLWVQFLTFGNPVQPSFFTATQSDVIVFNQPESKFKMAFYNAIKWCKRKYENLVHKS